MSTLFFSYASTTLFTFLTRFSETGKPRGFAFVGMANMEQAMDCINNLHETDFYGRPLRVSLSQPRGEFLVLGCTDLGS